MLPAAVRLLDCNYRQLPEKPEQVPEEVPIRHHGATDQRLREGLPLCLLLPSHRGLLRPSGP